MIGLALALLASVAALPAARAADGGNRLTYLDERDPYYVSRSFPKLTTPQWVGEAGVEAVVVLAIDDMRGHDKWEGYLRPILERLKKIDGRAPVSVMTNSIDPNHGHIQKWLKEGLSIDCHTVDHPCPLLGKDDFPRAKSTYDRCLDLLGLVPGNKPVGFRMPCCDSLNTPSPRFFSEIFNQTTKNGGFLTIDTSVFNITTPNDPDLPRDLVLDADGRETFRKYLPFPSFVNTIEDYPYPYVIAQLGWELPCAVPSDWQAQHLHKRDNPITVRDFKAAIDVTVLKQGTYTMVFHPHGWIRNDQIVEVIDHVTAKHGGKVKFLTLREVQERMDTHLLGHQPLRAANGQDNGVRLLDLDADGFVDVVVGNETVRQTRIWSTKDRAWRTGGFPTALVTVASSGERHDAGVRFGVASADGRASMFVNSETAKGAWRWDGDRWVSGLPLLPVATSRKGRDRGVRLRDLDGDGLCEAIVSNPEQQIVFSLAGGKWRRLPAALPRDTMIVDAAGTDRGLRFVDIDQDGRADVIFSNEERYSLHLFDSMATGWGRLIKSGTRPAQNEIPMIVRGPTLNGAWFHSQHMWVQNENTAAMKDLVDRRSFAELLRR